MYGKEIEKVLIPRGDVEKRLKEVAGQIGRDYDGQDVLFICVLRGAFMFFADMVREISEYNVNAQVDFIAVELRRRHRIQRRGKIREGLHDARRGEKRNYCRRYRRQRHYA